MSEAKNGGLAGILALVALLVIIMIASIYYPFPSGKTMTFSGFVQLWFREIILVSLITVALLIAVIRRLRPFSTRDGKQNDN